ncbi:MAG: squalene/phytoene synthase family protein [Bacteroidales bacterium]|nr:squalene/phytoene synthase family protein [Bacteroidales bacterium]
MNIAEIKPADIIKSINFEEIKDHPNILIAARFWEEDRYVAAKTCYKFMRKIDDLIDNNKAVNGCFKEEEKESYINEVYYWINCLESLSSNDPLFTEVKDTIERFKIPVTLFYNFALSMIYDINHTGFDTVDSFIDYAEGASVAPASVFVHLCCLKKTNGSITEPYFNVEDYARPCALFSYLVHIIRDFQKDQKNNLNYFANNLLDKYNIKAYELKQMAEQSKVTSEFRAMIKEYYMLAEKYKKETENILPILDPQLDPIYRLSLHIIFNLYLQVFERIDIENGTFTTEELNPKPYEIKYRVQQIINKLG